MNNMKKAIPGIFLATCISAGAFAQDQNGFSDRGYGHRHSDMAQLNLTDQQKSELKTINEDFKQQMTDLKKNEDITVREWKSKMATIRKEHHEKVQNVLTDDQKASLKKMMQERRAEMKKHSARRMEQMKKELNLTDDQVAALKKSHEDMSQKFKAIRDDKSLSDDQKKAQLKDLRDQQHNSLKSILTEEQLQKMQQMHKHGKHHRQQPPVQS
jgi:Spy/CpxP family protein refolding chaperone